MTVRKMKKLIPVLGLCALAAACTTGPVSPRNVHLPVAPPPGEPAGTTGLHEADLRGFYGQPAFIRKDGTGTIWRYDASNGCKVFFFLYTKDTNTAVWHVETTPHPNSSAADQACLDALHARTG
jgi:hypothetical protein